MVTERQTVHWRTFLYPGQILFGLLLGLLVADFVRTIRSGPPGLKGALEVVGILFLTLWFVLYLQNLHKRPLQPDYSNRCYLCRMPVNRWSEFCEHCGADLVERHRLVTCANCDTQVYETNPYCPDCGSALKAKKRR